jgi:hypothetical protein
MAVMGLATILHPTNSASEGVYKVVLVRGSMVSRLIPVTYVLRMGMEAFEGEGEERLESEEIGIASIMKGEGA